MYYKLDASLAGTPPLALHSHDAYTVTVYPRSPFAWSVKISCTRALGAAAEFDPAPPDAWDHDFGKIHSQTSGSRAIYCTARGAAVLRVNALEYDDGGGAQTCTVNFDVHLNVK